MGENNSAAPLFQIHDAEVVRGSRTILSVDDFELYEGETCIGTLKKELTFFKPKYNIDFNGWHVEGDFAEWDYTITGPDGGTVAAVSKEPFRWTDTYVLDITDPKDALYVLMFVLAIDAEKCSRN